jgi:hypothetical protein
MGLDDLVGQKPMLESHYDDADLGIGSDSVMKSTVFVRPNLKMFLLGAILIAVIQQLITSVHSQAPTFVRPLNASAREVLDAELQDLLKRAAESPNAEVYTSISRCYEKRGEYKKAILYLRRAEKIGQAQDSGE